MGLRAQVATHARVAAGVLVVCALVAVQLYIYSPWHRHPQGRQYCCFNPVEHGNSLQPSSSVAIVQPALTCCDVAQETTPLAEGRHFQQRPSRAPPA